MPRRLRSFTSAMMALVAAVCALALSASSAFAVPWAPKEEKPRERFREVPPKKLIENLPASRALMPAPEPMSVPAISETSGRTDGSASWTFLGPAPIPNGQTNGRQDPVSGRVTAIAVHPTNAEIAYVGTAQGGLYRTLNGGGVWTQLMDNANAPSVGTPLAIGAVTIDPTNSTRVFVGTGEGNLSGDSFFGTGFYIITASESGNPTVSGPFNAASGNDPTGDVPAGSDVFTGRSIVAIAVDPTNANNIFVSTSSGVGGILGVSHSILPRRGLYRSTNALSGSPTWTRLHVAGTSVNTISTSVVMEPGNPNHLIVAMFNQDPTDPHGIYRSTNALAATPNFSQRLAPAVPIPDATPDPRFINIKLAIQKSPTNVVTVYATSDEPSAQPMVDDGYGTVYKSVDGGVNWNRLTGADGFAGFQGFYDLAVGVDPTNPNHVSVGGQAGNRIFRRSQDGGATFTIDTEEGPGAYATSAGLHADTHAIAYAPSNGNIVYHGNDGGIWRSNDGGTTWISLNNSTFSATQFVGLAVHPTDAKFSIGGTQDNGTPQLRPDSTWFRVDFGDGGYSLIDQNATDTTNVTQYHTYFNAQEFLTGTGRVLTNPCAVEGQWAFRGIFANEDGSAPGTPNPAPVCDGSPGEIFNGIGFFDFVNFYAPMALGPGNPNTWYFGTDRLYRSSNRADTAAVASAFLGDFVNAIAIAPQDDNYRIVGTNFGLVFATTTGGALVQIGGPGATRGPVNVPANFPGATGAPVNRIAIDPHNKNIAYIAYGAFGTPAAPVSHVYKISNLDALTNGGAVIFTAMSNGLPDLPANALAIDPQSGSASRASSDIYVGTDIGVYKSSNGGASWARYLSGLPRVSVFALEIQSSARLVRAATHGRGMYDAPITASPAIPPALSMAVSRKTHGGSGAFDVNMPLVAPSGVEPRRGSGSTPGTFTIVLRFTNTVVSGTASYAPGSGAACNGGIGTCTGTAGATSFSGTDMTVTLTNVGDVQTGTLTVTDVTDANGNTLASASMPLGFNVGDVTGNRTVNSGDAFTVKNRSGAAVDLSSFQSDVNTDASINSGDSIIVKNKSGSTIP